MKLLITGSNGQLGREMREVLERRVPGISTYVGHEELDLTDRTAVETFLAAGDFTHIINCAAYTAVDKAEEEKMQCAAVNVDAVSNLARLADELGFKIVHFSTDYVFDGNNCRPYTESDKPEPMSVYGVTKRRGETALIGLSPESIIIRTGWLYSSFGSNFVKTILKRAKDTAPLRVVADQIGSPTYAADLAETVVDIILAPHWTPGIFHYTNEGIASWYDFAVAVLEEAGYPERAAAVVPITSGDLVCAASRPLYGVLSKARIKATFNINIPHWHAAMRRCLAKMPQE
ncbi:MAG: dTDP-4-dehydrorhamnose reductase [Muribaculaceae bacterium]|nr:dTDP-4-dehydrorhamnose reductase [Muribaculaceae bacterium]